MRHLIPPRCIGAVKDDIRPYNTALALPLWGLGASYLAGLRFRFAQGYAS